MTCSDNQITIVVEGGVIQAIVANSPDLIFFKNITIVEYGADEDLRQNLMPIVDNSCSSVSLARVVSMPITKAQIELLI